MDGAGQQRLAGAGLTGDQDRRPRRRDGLDGLQHLMHLRVTADHVVEFQAVVQRFLEVLVLDDQLVGPRRLVHRDVQLLGGEGENLAAGRG